MEYKTFFSMASIIFIVWSYGMYRYSNGKGRSIIDYSVGAMWTLAIIHLAIKYV